MTSKATNPNRALFFTVLSATLIMSMGTVVRADDRQELEATVASLNTMDAKHGERELLFARIAAETGVSVETLRKHQANTGLGFGSLLVAHEVAKASGKAFADVAAEFKAGKAAGQIAADANVKLNTLTKIVQSVEAKVVSERRDLEKRLAKENQDLEKRIAALNAHATNRAEAVYARISAQTGVAVERLRKEKEASGLGFGGLLIATEISRASGKNFVDVVAEFKTGKGWGEIAAESNLKLGKMISSAAQVNTAVERDHRNVTAQGNAKAGGEQAGNRGAGSVGAAGVVGAPPVRVPTAPVVPVGPRK